MLFSKYKFYQKLKKINIGAVRRSDLYLRADYPELETVIYRIDESQFLIYSKDFPEDFESFNREFNDSIRLIFASGKQTRNLSGNYR